MKAILLPNLSDFKGLDSKTELNRSERLKASSSNRFRIERRFRLDNGNFKRDKDRENSDYLDKSAPLIGIEKSLLLNKT